MDPLDLGTCTSALDYAALNSSHRDLSNDISTIFVNLVVPELSTGGQTDGLSADIRFWWCSSLKKDTCLYNAGNCSKQLFTFETVYLISSARLLEEKKNHITHISPLEGESSPRF